MRIILTDDDFEKLAKRVVLSRGDDKVGYVQIQLDEDIGLRHLDAALQRVIAKEKELVGEERFNEIWQEETMTDEEILALVKSGASNDEIIRHIHVGDFTFERFLKVLKRDTFWMIARCVGIVLVFFGLYVLCTLV